MRQEELDAQEAYMALVNEGRDPEPEPPTPKMIAAAEADLNLPGLDGEQRLRVCTAYANGFPITAYLPENERVRLVILNSQALKKKGTLETSWLNAYIYVNDLTTTSLDDLHQMFEECDGEKLRQEAPIPDGDRYHNGKSFILFRGVAGPDHRKGMSWAASLGKALYYAKWHAVRSDEQPAVYAACVDRSEIYCCLKDNELEFITCPREWWRVNVPDSWFRVDMPR